MKESALRDALRRIQDIVSEETGRNLPERSERRVTAVLSGLLGLQTDHAATDSFSSRNVTILLADLRGFTALTATYPAGVVLELLNRCFVRMSEIIVKHRGTIDKFMGDSIMVVFFGDAADPAGDVTRAIQCAVDMQIGMQALSTENARAAKAPELFMGIGINTGTVMAGLLGSEVYSAYTIIGEDVNLASRIEAFSLRGQVLISEGTYRHCKDYAATGEPMQVYVKGKAERVTVREVLGIPSLGKELPRQEIRRSPRVEVSLPFEYQVVEDKIVIPAKSKGVILDIGYHGALAEIHGPLLEHAELKLQYDLPLVGFTVTDVYARVVKTIKKGPRVLYGLEFTSLDADTTANLQLFVQMLIQGSDTRAHGGR